MTVVDLFPLAATLTSATLTEIPIPHGCEHVETIVRARSWPAFDRLETEGFEWVSGPGERMVRPVLGDLAGVVVVLPPLKEKP